QDDVELVQPRVVGNGAEVFALQLVRVGVARGGEEPLAVQAERGVARDEIDRLGRPVLGQRLRAAGDHRKAGETPALSQRAVAGLAVVDEVEIGGHSGHAGRYLDGNRVDRGAARADREIAGE